MTPGLWSLLCEYIWNILGASHNNPVC